MKKDSKQSKTKENLQENRPNAPMIGADGNIFAQLGIASKALRESGQSTRVSEMSAKVMGCDSYNKALGIICEYVNPVQKSERPKSYER
jgi:hypothetical protein